MTFLTDNAKYSLESWTHLMVAGRLPIVGPGIVQAVECVGAEGAVELRFDCRVLGGEDYCRGVALAAQELELCRSLVSQLLLEVID